MTNRKGIREVALDILESIEKKSSYSNLLLKHAIEKYNVSKKDANLLTEMIYGTLQRKLTIDYYLQPFIKKTKKIEPWVMILLRLSVYQFAYLSKIPDHAIIHEAVEIGKKRGHKGIASFINGVLRSIQRKGLPSIESFTDPIDRLAIETSHPKWLVQKWVDQFGMDQTTQMCYENNTPPKQTARINRWKTSPQNVIDRLKQEGIDVKLSEHLPNAIQISQGHLASTFAFQKGWISIQDESSMLVGFAIDPKEGERILDTCSAPGGKATDMAERMNNTGTIIACDLHSHKLKLIEENKRRLGLTNIETIKCDARKASAIFPPESFDRILVDAPCSGLGVIRRKPEIKYTKSEEDIQNLVKIQKEILHDAAKLVKKGGLLVYSTCTVVKEENEEVAEHFLKTHPDFERDTTFADRLPQSVQPFIQGNRLQLFPQNLQSDGFFIASFKKKV
ncbi:16S rRNA (cytosine(967)-C(5))-methyltransferase RsmB [Fervidibacillus halotolerans]|uniref:16S rRNA (cytosine(967)-C(5))-methyltransferase n=1 Tax=Fervidibacillus halotolerans TaxID=2980027 RepID=A0A9E8RZR9_9BACI|nr:16S rRNA (cytosine(967)-C(5))-methyltransferase RsmB [Fervidibacillus halotolerans]WAA13653.1 16S rRNA (cytosine(967)-C(5))-methyltransferase RsmB [Fervidibacillus halotolerans]